MKLLLLTLTLFSLLVVSDNFNDGVIDSNLWTAGSGFYADPLAYNGSVSVDESAGQLQLTYTHSGYWSANAYVSNSVYDVRDKRVSARLQRNGADAWLAVGESQFELADVTIMDAGGTALRFRTFYANRYDAYDYFWISAADYDPVQDTYVALRFNRRGVYCETSPDGVNWTAHGLVKGKLDFTSHARIELGGGGFFPFTSPPVTSMVDDFKIE